VTPAQIAELFGQDARAGQRAINQFVDDFRRASPPERAKLIAVGPRHNGGPEGLIAAVVSSLCHGTDLTLPLWVTETRSEQPFFAFDAKSGPLRVRLMLESPPPFRARNVFVPENYLSRV